MKEEASLTPRKVFELLLAVSILGLSYAIFATEVLPLVVDSFTGAM